MVKKVLPVGLKWQKFTPKLLVMKQKNYMIIATTMEPPQKMEKVVITKQSFCKLPIPTTLLLKNWWKYVNLIRIMQTINSVPVRLFLLYFITPPNLQIEELHSVQIY